MVSFESQTYSKKLLHLISWSHWFTFFNIIAAIVLSTVYLINEASPDTFAGYVYLTTTWLSHMAFLTFITFVLTVFPLTLLVPRTRFIRASASIIFTVVLLLLCLDAFIYNRLGYHINASSTSQIIDLITEEVRQDRRTFWFITIILSLVILTFELTVSNYAWKHLKELQKAVFARFVVVGLVACFFVSHLMHIWADANLEYDVLKQDTILPLSYPTTAKTLLTKYGLFNKEDYIERRTSPLSFNDPVPSYPTLKDTCEADEPANSTFIILSEQTLTAELINQFSQRSTASEIRLEHHIDNAQGKDAWFNLLYGLPSIYQANIEEQQVSPILLQLTELHGLKSTFTFIGDKTNAEALDFGFKRRFDKQTQYDDITKIVLPTSLKAIEQGLHVIYFDKEKTAQFELFIDALLLAQKQQKTKDNIIISSIGNETSIDGLAIKPALMVMPGNKSKRVNNLTSQMDIAPTLVQHWLGCKSYKESFAGTNLLRLKSDRVIANTVDNGMVVFNKDKSVLIDQNGNFQSYSRQLSAPITVSSDFPLMIDGVHFIKRYSQQQSNN